MYFLCNLQVQKFVKMKRVALFFLFSAFSAFSAFSQDMSEGFLMLEKAL
jgi:hypothetical protein